MSDATYPLHWEADVLTADGAVARIRPVAPGDEDKLRDMHRRLSAESRYLRYFSAVGEMTDSQLRLFTDVDHARRVTLVVERGESIVAAGSYYADDADASRAEVAFTVQDDQQRRGLGSILLEHLAAAAHERGIDRFTAEVLGENRKMLGVFLDAGYEVTRKYDSGVVVLAFDISPTVASRRVWASREQRAEARSIARLLHPRSVAVIGASNDQRKVGHAVLVNLLRAFAGPVYPVNGEAVAVQGVRAYASVIDIPDPVDLAVVAVPAPGVAEVMRACRDKGVRGLVVVSAGFADAGDDGASAQHTLVRLARDAGMRVLGPNCLGLVNTDARVRLNATLAPVVPAAGRVGFFCQSGALGIAILADAAHRGLGLSSFVSAGNRADVSGNDLLQFWQSDERTEVVLLYLESFGNPRKFARLARTLARVKPVIAVKSGRHALLPSGLKINASPMSDAAVESLFGQSGVIRTATLSEGFDVALLLSCQPLPSGRSVAIIGNSTALGLLAYDACLDAGLTVSGGAPVDLGAAVGPERLAAVVAEATSSGVGAVLVVFVPPVAMDGSAHAAALRRATGGSPVPVASTFLAMEGVPATLMAPGDDDSAPRGSVPSYRSPERAVAAIAAAAHYGEWLATPAGNVVRPEVDEAAGAQMLAAMSPDEGVRAMTSTEIVELLACYGINLQWFAPSSHHNGGLAADSLSADSLPGEADGRHAPTVFGMTADPSFGAVISFGVGGVATELLDDRAYRAVPLTDRDATELIDEPRAAPLLDGGHGFAPADRGPLIDLVQRLSALADDIAQLHSLKLECTAVSTGRCLVSAAAGMIGPAPTPVDDRRRL